MNILRKITHSLRANIIINNYKNIIKPNHRVIDIGTDSGFIANKIKKAFNCEVECCDITNNLKYDMQFHLINDSKIGVADKSFDIAMLNDTLHHVPLDSQIKLIKEAERISKKVLIFEAKINFVVWITDKLDELKGMPCPMAHRDINEWKTVLHDFTYKKVKKPIYYPITNYIFIKK